MKAIPLDGPAQRFKTNTPTIDAVVELVREFSNLPNGSRLQRRDKVGINKKEDVAYELACDPSFEPTAIHKLWNSTRSNSEGRQEDAEEFLGYVLNKLNDEMLEVGVDDKFGRHSKHFKRFWMNFQMKKLVEKPAAPPANEVTANGIDLNGETADDEGEEWQASVSLNVYTFLRTRPF